MAHSIKSKAIRGRKSPKGYFIPSAFLGRDLRRNFSILQTGREREQKWLELRTEGSGTNMNFMITNLWIIIHGKSFLGIGEEEEEEDGLAQVPNNYV